MNLKCLHEAAQKQSRAASAQFQSPDPSHQIRSDQSESSAAKIILRIIKKQPQQLVTAIKRGNSEIRRDQLQTLAGELPLQTQNERFRLR